MRIPEQIVPWVMLSRLRALSGWGPGFCIVCDRHVPAFLPYRRGNNTLSPVLRELELVGSNLERFRCPRCASSDRERHLLAYLRARGPDFAGKRILHFAPERHLRSWIQAQAPREYVQGDLFPTEAQIQKIDITRIPHADAHFDIVIANHVLEHVPDDAAAMREIARVLSRGGHAILQTPYAAGIGRSIELPIQSEAGRLLLYGQEDHVRLYGTDLVTRIQAAGLESRMAMHDEALPDVDPTLHGMSAHEPYLLFARV